MAFFKRAKASAKRGKSMQKINVCYVGYWRKEFVPSFTGMPWSAVNSSDVFDDFYTKEGNWAGKAATYSKIHVIFILSSHAIVCNLKCNSTV